MAQFGWVLFIDRSKCEAKTLKEIKAYFQDCFNQIKPLLINGLRFASIQENIGTACIVGPDNECLILKTKIEQMGIGNMIPNMECIGPA